MARCAGCGSNLAEKSRFCSICGREVANPTSAFAAPAPTIQPGQPTGMTSNLPSADANGKKKVAIAAGAGAIVMAIALLLFLKAAGVLGSKQTEAPVAGVLAAPASRPSVAPVLGQPPVAQPSAPVLNPPQVAENPMPDDVVKYLLWLKQFDAARAQLEYKGYASYMKVMTSMSMGGAQAFMQSMNAESEGGSPSNTASKPLGGDSLSEIAQVIGQMNEATGKFQSYPPPNPCASLANSYNTALKAKVSTMATLQNMIGQIVNTQNQAMQGNGNTDTSALSEMLPKLMEQYQNQGMSKEVDAADNAANQALNTLRSQYTSMPEEVGSFTLKKVDIPSPSIPGMGM